MKYISFDLLSIIRVLVIILLTERLNYLIQNQTFPIFILLFYIVLTERLNNTKIRQK